MQPRNESTSVSSRPYGELEESKQEIANQEYLEHLDECEFKGILEFGEKLIPAVSEHKEGPIKIKITSAGEATQFALNNIIHLYGCNNCKFDLNSNQIIIPADKVNIFKPYVDFIKPPSNTIVKFFSELFSKNPPSNIDKKLPYLKQTFFSNKYKKNRDQIYNEVMKEVKEMNFRQPSAYKLKPGQELIWRRTRFHIIPEIASFEFEFALKDEKANEYIYVTKALAERRVTFVKNNLQPITFPVTFWKGARNGDYLTLDLSPDTGYKSLYWVNPKPKNDIKGPSFFTKVNDEKVPLVSIDEKEAPTLGTKLDALR